MKVMIHLLDLFVLMFTQKQENWVAFGWNDLAELIKPLAILPVTSHTNSKPLVEPSCAPCFNVKLVSSKTAIVVTFSQGAAARSASHHRRWWFSSVFLGTGGAHGKIT